MTEQNWLTVTSVDLEAQGIARDEDGKVVFIEDALPGEQVRVRRMREKNQWIKASVIDRIGNSALRTTPPCPHFGTHLGACGGCSMQHIDLSAQIAIKQRALEDQLWHLGKVKVQQILRPMTGLTESYRSKARLSVRYVRKKDEVLIGFHERRGRYIADMQSCTVLVKKVSDLLMPLRMLIAHLSVRELCPQIEVAHSDTATALVLRHLKPLSTADQQALHDFGSIHDIQWWLQPEGPTSAHLLDPNDNRVLTYALPEFGVALHFRPTDFTQVNPEMNRFLVRLALSHLNPQVNERVIDWFCGLGNFTLPIATRAREVLGIEGSRALVERAKANAHQQTQNLRADFAERNLFEMTPDILARDGHADKWLIDPPREGAFALVKALAEMPTTHPNWQAPKRIVYVSCNPATLARDAGILVHLAGYRCAHAGIVNMFSHTAHVESIAVFELT